VTGTQTVGDETAAGGPVAGGPVAGDSVAGDTVVSDTAADEMPVESELQDPADLAWEAVPDAPGLHRATLVKADGRRMTVYRRPADGRGPGGA
jgi:hypothetical protein